MSSVDLVGEELLRNKNDRFELIGLLLLSASSDSVEKVGL
jgi:hypothetical protein